MTRREPPPEPCGRRGHKAMKHRRNGDRGGRNEQQHEVDGDNASEKSGHRQRQEQMLRIAAVRNPADEARRFSYSKNFATRPRAKATPMSIVLPAARDNGEKRGQSMPSIAKQSTQ